MCMYFIRTKATRPQKIMSKIKTFVFLDLETTGLPHLENNKTKITELTLVAVQSEQLSGGVLPRVQNKLSLCFNPRKLISYDSERITGLSNYILENLSSFSPNTIQSINLFLEHNPKPICFVAHNGNRFDYPILQSELQRSGVSLINDILCIDSLPAFRQLHLEETKLIENSINSLPQDTIDSPLEFQDGFDELLCQAVEEYESQSDPIKTGLNKALEMQKINETTPKKQTITPLNGNILNLAIEEQIGNGDILKRPGSDGGSAGHSNIKKPKVVRSRMRLNFGLSFKLVDVYQRLTNSDAVDAHRAEGDVQMLLMCAATLGDRFITWANQNAKNFCDIPAMAPGKKMCN